MAVGYVIIWLTLGGRAECDTVTATCIATNAIPQPVTHSMRSLGILGMLCNGIAAVVLVAFCWSLPCTITGIFYGISVSSNQIDTSIRKYYISCTALVTFLGLG